MSIETGLLPEREWEKGKVLNVLIALLACVAASAAYYQFMVRTAVVELDLRVSEKSNFALYWADDKSGYSEKRVATIKVHPKQESYSFYLTDISKVARLRVDTHKYAGDATLKRLAIHQEGYGSIVLDDEDSFAKLSALQQIEKTNIDEGGLWLEADGEDPNFELVVTAHPLGFDIPWLVTRLLVISVLVFAVVYSCAPLVKNLALVPILLFGVWLLIIAMAAISKENVHPDEYVHIAATAYYAEHWLPPAVDDPEIRNTYSVYGVSRLNHGEIYYFFSGKTYALLEFLNLPQHLAYRFFNVALFGGIFFFSIRNLYARIAALPYLVSSQVWYVFSYCSSDAFALFITYLASWQLIDPDSILHRYLRGGGALIRLCGLVVLPILLGTLFILKMNYYPFVGLLFLILGVRLLFTEEYYWEKKDACKRLALVTVLGLSFLGLRVGLDYAVNGPDRKEKIAAAQEEYGDYAHKKSTPAKERVSTLYMKDRGISIRDLIAKYHWDIQTLQSSFGVFGYFTITSPKHYYVMVQWFGAALLLFILISSLARGGLFGAGVTGVVCVCSLLLILASLHRSWIADFQPQGRYLFPIIPMFGIALGHNIKAIDRRVLLLLVSFMSILGLYSFIFHGLLKIPKIPF